MKNKKLLILVTTLIIATILGVSYAIFLRKDDTAKLPSTPEELKTIEYGPSKSTDKLQPSSKDKVIERQKMETTDSTASENKFNLTITNSSQQGQMVYLRAIVNGSLNGTCKLSLENGAHFISRQAPYLPQASYAICQGFNIPVSDFPISGTWKATLTATDTEGGLTSTTSTVEVNK